MTEQRRLARQGSAWTDEPGGAGDCRDLAGSQLPPPVLPQP